jgi:dinuclear metal center YbgI/SA1388 family protein
VGPKLHMALSPFRAVAAALESLAPLSLAGAWDNVGALVAHVAPPPPGSRYNIYLTNDVTPHVLDDALTAFDGGAASLIVTYHPTPFSGLKRFTMESPASRLVLTAARHNIAVFSPHTSWDAAPGMLNDWLLEGIVSAAGCGGLASVAPVKRAAGPAGEGGAGDGRVGALTAPASLAALVAGVKAHLGLPAVALSLPASHAAAAAGGAAAVAAAAAAIQVRDVAVCAGSGAGVLGGFCGAQLWVTGELSHHELLAASAAGVAVVLTHHSNSERGFLRVAAEKLRRALAGQGEFDIRVSAVDADPLTLA